MNCFLLVWTNRQKDVRRTQGWTLDKTQYPGSNWKCSLIMGRFYSFPYTLCRHISPASILWFHTRLVKDFNILISRPKPARMEGRVLLMRLSLPIPIWWKIIIFQFYFLEKTCKRFFDDRRAKKIHFSSFSESIFNFPGGILNKKMEEKKLNLLAAFPAKINEKEFGGKTKELKLDFKQNKKLKQ